MHCYSRPAFAVHDDSRPQPNSVAQRRVHAATIRRCAFMKSKFGMKAPVAGRRILVGSGKSIYVNVDCWTIAWPIGNVNAGAATRFSDWRDNALGGPQDSAGSSRRRI